MVSDPQVSAPKEILEALITNNPFDKPPVVKAQNIWGESFPDVSSLNAHASDAVFQTLDKVETATSSLEKVTSIVITADRGVGKTHLIRRIRKRLQANSGTLFVYASADEYSDLDFVNSAFLRSLAESLEKPGSQGITQWQEVASLMVADALKASNPNANVPSAPELVAKFDKAFQNNLAKGKDLVTDLTKAIYRLKPGSDPYIIRAIICTLSEERGMLAVKWLAGEALDIQDAVDLRLPPNNKSEKEREADALSTVSKVISLLGEYRKVLICFDELDTIGCNSNGFPTQIVIMDLVKKLFDSISQYESSHGVVILTVLLPDSWRSIKQDKDASSEKISTAHKEPIELRYIDSTSINELVALWLHDFYQARGFNPSSPIYPFNTGELLQYAKGKPSVREALEWCSNILIERINSIAIELPKKRISFTERLEKAYQHSIELFSSEYLEDNILISEILKFCFDKIITIEKISCAPIEGVIITGLEEVTPKSKNGGYLQFKVIGTENNEPVSIGIGVLQQTFGLSVGAGFRRLLDYETFGLTRGCLVRSRDRKLKRNWDSYQYYQQLVEKGGEWVDLKEEELKPLFAVKNIYDNHEKFELTIKRLDSLSFVQKTLTQSPLLKEILSKPEGQIHQESLEGEELQHLHSEEESQEIMAHLQEVLDHISDEDTEEKLELGELEVA